MAVDICGSKLATLRMSYRSISALLFVAIALWWVPNSAAVEKPAATASTLLSQDEWAKILKQLKEKGISRTLPTRVTEELGLTKGAETLSVLELAVEREGYKHGIYMSPSLGQDRPFVIFVFGTPENRWMGFVTDLHLKLVAAATWNTGETPIRLPKEAAQSAFDNELGSWAVLAELF